MLCKMTIFNAEMAGFRGKLSSYIIYKFFYHDAHEEHEV